MKTPSQKLRAGDAIEVAILKLDRDGLGRADYAGRTVIVEDALPGEAGTARVTHVGIRIYARMALRTKDHEERRCPPCVRWTAASPCRIMHLAPAAQARFKRESVITALSELAPGTRVHDLIASPEPLFYRAKAIYVAARTRDGELVLGAYRRGSHLVQRMPDCAVEEPSLTRAHRALERASRGVLVADPGLPVATDDRCGAPLSARLATPPRSRKPRLHPMGLRYVVLRANAKGEVAAALLTPSGQLSGGATLAGRAREDCPALKAVFVGASGPGDAIFGDAALEPICGSMPLREDFAGLTFTISPRSFFQVNRHAAELLHALAAERAGRGTLVDAYAGVGALSLRLARGARVIGIECVADAVENARHNALQNGLAERVEFRLGDAASGLQDLVRESIRIDAIVMNPPRSGASVEVLTQVIELAPPRVVYLSCEPRTLARDLAHLCKRGYRLSSVVPVDLFPQTEHVECVALLERDAPEP